MQKRFIQLIEEETATLQEGMKNGAAHLFRKRCHCLILSNDGYEVKNVAAVLGVSWITIYSWLDRWEKKGLVGLRDQAGRGRKPILTIADFALVKECVEQNAQQLRVARVQLKEELKRDFSDKTLRRYIKNLIVDIKDGASV